MASRRPVTAPASLEQDEDRASHFNVCVRIRPESERERESGSRRVVQVLDENVLVFDPKGDNEPDLNASLRGFVRRNPRVLQRRARYVMSGRVNAPRYELFGSLIAG